MTKDFQEETTVESHTPLEKSLTSSPVRVREIAVDWEELAMAFENQLPEIVNFLDLNTGRVVTFNQNSESSLPEVEEPFLRLEPRPSREGYRTMKLFIQTVEDPNLRRELESSLIGRGAFRRFKDRLLNYPQERQRWFAFKDAAVFEYARSWLQEKGVFIINPPPQHCPRSVEDTSEANAAPPDSDFASVIAPYERPGLVFRPEKAALLLIDLQLAFLEPGASAYIPASAQVVARLRLLLDRWRREKLPVFFTRHVHCYPQRDGGSMARWWHNLILEGTREAEISPLLAPLPGEPVVSKCRYGAFSGTSLEAMLRASGVEDLVIGGVMTNLCCETTAREAFMRDFNVFFLGDGTATSEQELHEATLRNIAYGFGRVISCNEVTRVLDSFRSTTGATDE